MIYKLYEYRIIDATGKLINLEQFGGDGTLGHIVAMNERNAVEKVILKVGHEWYRGKRVSVRLFGNVYDY